MIKTTKKKKKKRFVFFLQYIALTLCHTKDSDAISSPNKLFESHYKSKQSDFNMKMSRRGYLILDFFDKNNTSS